MNTTLTVAIFVAILAIPQFTSNVAFAHTFKTKAIGYEKRSEACKDAKNEVKHGHKHKYSRCKCEKSDGLWSCTVTYG